MSYIMVVLAWIGVILGLFMRKLSGLEAMFVVQFGWLSVLWINSIFYMPF